MFWCTNGVSHYLNEAAISACAGSKEAKWSVQVALEWSLMFAKIIFLVAVVMSETCLCIK